MIKKFVYIIAIVFSNCAFAQTFLNGGFELNSLVEDRINLQDAQYNSLMQYSSAFGTLGNMDIINAGIYCGGAKEGDWFVALTGGGTDASSMELSEPLLEGSQLSFFFL